MHNFLITNEIRTAIWEQLHLNFYTQFSYNIWHGKQDVCPLCRKYPDNIYHIILHCDFTEKLWKDIEPVLKKLYPARVTEEEKALGIVQKKATTGILVRNYITYSMRAHIMKMEQEAYHTPNKVNVAQAKVKFNQSMALQVKRKLYQYKYENKLEFFDKIVTHANVLCQKVADDEYRMKQVFL